MRLWRFGSLPIAQKRVGRFAAGGDQRKTAFEKPMIYFDNAATSFPKPPEVQEAVLRALGEWGNPGRGSHKMAIKAAEGVYAAREALASFFDCPDPLRVVLTPGATHSINLAIKGLLRPGDHAVCSNLEHNAVYRPLERLAREGKITYDRFAAYDPERALSEEEICRNLAAKLRKNTRLVICTHASNICSCALPLEAMGRLLRARGIFLCVDGAQSAGRLPISLERMKIDALCLPGHKGLFGPAGCGALLLGENCLPMPLLEGGSGYRSFSPDMPEESPERYEAGTLPTPAIAGLMAGLNFVEKVGISEIEAHETALAERLKERLSSVPDVKIYAPERKGSILLFSSGRYPASAIGEELDRRGFCVRTGFHCAALAHKTLKTPETGAVRVSTGFFNTRREIDALADALDEIFQNGI